MGREREREITKLTFRTSPKEHTIRISLISFHGVEKALVTNGSYSVPCCMSQVPRVSELWRPDLFRVNSTGRYLSVRVGK